jgi:26S proteasome regulatory subunit N6
MGDKLDEINNIIYGKHQQKYCGKEVEVLKEVEKAVRNKSTRMLGEICQQYKDILLTDNFMKHHLSNLHEELLEKNLRKIIEPYSMVEIDYITKTVGIDSNEILNKLSQMILDKKINGILDQGRGSLIIYEDSLTNEYLEKSLKVYKSLDSVVDSLFNKARKSNN